MDSSRPRICCFGHLLAAALTGVFFFSTTAQAATLTLDSNPFGVTDSYLRAGGNANTNQGASAELLVGNTAGSGDYLRSVIGFDLSGLPFGATITSVTLTLTGASNDALSATSMIINLHRLSVPFKEGDGTAGSGVTWNKSDGSSNWSTVGGSFDATVLSALSGLNPTTLSGAAQTFPDTVDLRQAVADAAGRRIDFILKRATEGGGRAVARFRSLETLAVAGKPTLTVTYDAPVYPAQPLGALGAATGWVNVKTWSADPSLNAKGDGVTDDAPAIQAAISANLPAKEGERQKVARIYLPAGTYRLGSALEAVNENGLAVNCLIFQGAGNGLTTLQLANGASGFGNATSPKAVIKTNNVGNEAFRNYLKDFTLNTGTGNPGAVGIDFMGNNSASIERVTVRSGDGAGLAGLWLTRDTPGPLLVRQFNVVGFATGIQVARRGYTATFEHVALLDQTGTALLNDQRAIAVRRLVVSGAPNAIKNTGTTAHLVLLDSALFPSGSAAAVVNEGALFARNLLTTQATAIQKGAVTVAGPTVTEYRSSATTQFNTTDTESLNLPVEETPERPTLAAGDWANAGDYGAVADNTTDDSAAIQAALNAGKRGVYLPATPGQPNVYRVKDKLVIPPGVEIFDLNYCVINPVQNTSSPQIVLEAAAPSGAAPALHVSNLLLTTYRPRFVLNPGRDLVLRSVEQIGVSTVGTGGRLFLQDYVTDAAGSLYVGPGWKVWARHYNPEGRKMQDLTVNDGADLWVLGLKTELPVINLRTSNNGRSEILGGNLFSVTASHPQLTPFIVTSGGQLSASLVLALDDPKDDFGNVVSEGVWSGSVLARSDPSVPVRSSTDSTLVLLRATSTASDPVVAEARTSATLSATPSLQLWFHADGAFELDRQADGSRRVRSWKTTDGSYGSVGDDYLCRFFQPERRATAWPGGLAAVRFDYSVLLFPDSVFINSYSGSSSKVTWAIAFAPDDYSATAPK